jgi:hypothetical protein
VGTGAAARSTFVGVGVAATAGRAGVVVTGGALGLAGLGAAVFSFTSEAGAVAFEGFEFFFSVCFGIGFIS